MLSDGLRLIGKIREWLQLKVADCYRLRLLVTELILTVTADAYGTLMVTGPGYRILLLA